MPQIKGFSCLLNKHDYTYTDALPVLQKVHEVKWPVILCSSKTASELTVLARELRLSSAPLICENALALFGKGMVLGPNGARFVASIETQC